MAKTYPEPRIVEDKWHHPDFIEDEVIGPWSLTESLDEKNLVNAAVRERDAILTSSTSAKSPYTYSGRGKPSSASMIPPKMSKRRKAGPDVDDPHQWNGFILHHPGGMSATAIGRYVSQLKEVEDRSKRDGRSPTEFEIVQAIKKGEAGQWEQMSKGPARGHYMIGIYGDIYVWHEASSGEVAPHTGSPNISKPLTLKSFPSTDVGKQELPLIEKYLKTSPVETKTVNGERWKDIISGAGLEKKFKYWLNRWENSTRVKFNDPSKPNPIELCDELLGISDAISFYCIGIDFVIAGQTLQKILASSKLSKETKDAVKNVTPELCMGPNGYSNLQYSAFNELVNVLKTSEVLPDTFSNQAILGHEDITPLARRWDPGGNFCWDRINLPERNRSVGVSRSRRSSADVASENPEFIGGVTPVGYVESGGKSHVIDSYGPADYLTPEEVRKGIIAQYFQIQDWHMVIMSEAMGENTTSPTNSNPQNTAPNTTRGTLAVNRKLSQANTNSSSTTLKVLSDINGEGASGDWIIRDRLAMSIVEAEFYRRRYRARNVPAVTGPFNPYPVAGFPGLILSPLRPVIGMVSNVTHNINVASANATTTVSLSSPRYWDEGEVWYWLGGENIEDRKNNAAKSIHSVLGDDTQQNDGITRFFPVWHNRYTVATNSFPPRGGERIDTNIDRFYQHFLGCNSIDFESNHRVSKFKDNDVVAYLESKSNPGNFDINEETLDIKEYNRLIASVDKKGRFAKGTIANKFWGSRSPGATEIEILSGKLNASKEYSKRYGIREHELFIQFLKNKYTEVQYRGRKFVIVSGPTFMSKPKGGNVVVNSIQKMLLGYNIEMKRRSTNIEGA